MKTEFYINTNDTANRGGSKVEIIGQAPNEKPYLYFKVGRNNPLGYIEGKELRQLATNILKAMNGKPKRHIKAATKK